MAFSVDQAFEKLQAARATGRLGHAYLIVGDPQGEAWELAGKLADLTAGTDPGAVRPVLEPESKLRQIVIKQIRALEETLRLRGARGLSKVGIIREADRMLPEASNAFLKTLEEPPPECLLLLLTRHPERLLETILSRCIRVTLRGEPGRTTDSIRDKVLHLLDRFASAPDAGLAEVMDLSREIGVILAEEKAALAEEHSEALAREKERYGKTTEGKWLEEREQYYKILTESRYVQRRMEVLDFLTVWWVDVMRLQQGREVLELREAENALRRLAEADPPGKVLDRLEALDQMRRYLERNLQETLVLDVGLMRAFG